MADVSERAKLRGLLRAATSGPWVVGFMLNAKSTPNDRGDRKRMISAPALFAKSDEAELFHEDGGCYTAADAALVVAAVNALPGLLDRIEELERRLAEVEGK